MGFSKVQTACYMQGGAVAFCCDLNISVTIVETCRAQITVRFNDHDVVETSRFAIERSGENG
ncbi:hypothetical protein [Paraburkholderia sediminicola]|uniref:hypothetical protein n=1 Tax=Paraburkholderia sediminicola TaxID=458836 RepID=UPI0038BA7D27